MPKVTRKELPKSDHDVSGSARSLQSQIDALVVQIEVLTAKVASLASDVLDVEMRLDVKGHKTASKREEVAHAEA